MLDPRANPKLPAQTRDAPMKDAFARLIDGVQLLVREHLELARVEIATDMRTLGRSLALAALGLPVLAAGWVLAMVAIALALPLQHWAGFAIVALLNLLAGGALTAVGVRRARRTNALLPGMTAELRRDKAMLG